MSKDQIPSWFYIESAITQDEIAAIQHELVPSLSILVPFYDSIPGTFNKVEVDLVKQLSPSLVTALERIGLLDKWTYAGIVIANKNFKDCWPVHTDDPNGNRCIALNLPLLNCVGTYTAWYEPIGTPTAEASVNRSAYKGQKTDPYYDTVAGPSNYLNKDVVEVARMPSELCSFINVGKLHRPVVEHMLPRVLISMRFWPEIFDYFD